MPASPIRDLGPCCVIWDPSGSNIELKPIHGTVFFRSEDQAEDIFEDGQGVTPIDAVFTGRLTELEVPMTRSSLTQLNNVIPGSVQAGSYLAVSNRVGQAMFASALEVQIKPIEDDVCIATDSQWLHLWRAYPMHAFEIGYDLSGQRIFLVKFKLFPDDTSGRVGEIWRMGTS